MGKSEIVLEGNCSESDVMMVICMQNSLLPCNDQSVVQRAAVIRRRKVPSNSSTMSPMLTLLNRQFPSPVDSTRAYPRGIHSLSLFLPPVQGDICIHA